jgi:hypothetical protein
VQKTTVILENVHTAGLESPDDHNKFQLQFQAILVNPKTTLNELKNAKDYYITAGVEYADGAYVWVGQAKITTVLIPQVARTRKYVIIRPPLTSVINLYTRAVIEQLIIRIFE